MTSAQLVPTLLVPLIVWRLYTRVRRNIGRQEFRPGRLQVRIAAFAAMLVLFGAIGFSKLPLVLGLVGGLVASVALAWLALRLTQFERTEDGIFYTPNGVIGAAVSLLFVARFAYRFVVLLQLRQAGAPVGSLSYRTPLTMATLGLLSGFYIVYSAGLLWRARHVPALAAD
jgi:hypothetical protein